MANPTIIIDAGHGGFDNGASDNGRLEKDDNLKLALAVGQRLEADGFPVVYTRTEDIYQRPIDKARIANESGGDYFVSFHRNSSPSRNMYSGVQTLVYEDSGIKGELASNINSELTRVGFADLGVPERKNLVVLRRTSMPAVLIETGFINTDSDNELFDSRFDDITNAIAAAIEKTVGTASVYITDNGETGNYSADGSNAGAMPLEDKRYGVQVGLFRRYSNASFLYNDLLNQGYTVQLTEKGPYYAVTVGDEPDVDAAQQLERELRWDGYDTLIVSR